MLSFAMAAEPALLDPAPRLDASCRCRIVLGNWKMNGDLASNRERLMALLEGLPALRGRVNLGVAVPAPYLAQGQARLGGSAVALGAQDVSDQVLGAYTGEVSAAMLREFGVSFALVGHSERRARHHESSALVAAKAAQAVAGGVVPVVCVGETLAERKAGRTEAVVLGQLEPVLALGQSVLDRVVLAYEPVWAIGTGEVATLPQIEAVHATLRARFEAVASRSPHILYGGSVKGANAAELSASLQIDGFLVGGASLVAVELLNIAQAAALSPA